jgi:hypothetical protein
MCGVLMQKISLASFKETFSTFRHSAFRLELLPEYVVDEERVEFAAYLDGVVLAEYPLPADLPWFQLIKCSCAEGKVFTRVRWMPEMLTPYIRYEIDRGYRFSSQAGERIRVFHGDVKVLPTAKTVPVLSDFWLFDDERCIILDYDERGMFLGAREVAADAVALYVALKKELLKNSEPLILD